VGHPCPTFDMPLMGLGSVSAPPGISQGMGGVPNLREYIANNRRGALLSALRTGRTTRTRPPASGSS
jgi:hypothetical protein